MLYTQLKGNRSIDVAADLYPRAEDGLRSMAAVSAVVESGHANAQWVDARPPMFRTGNRSLKING